MYNEEKRKSNKGLIVVTIILIIMVLGLCAYIAYDKYFMKEEPKTEDTQTITDTDTKTDTTTDDTISNEVPITDKSAFIIGGSSIGGSYIYCYIQDGNLYYYSDDRSGSSFELIGASYSDDKHLPAKKYDGLTNIKRIKVFNEGTSVAPRLYLITEDGKVYIKKVLSTYTDIGFEQVNDLKDYQVDDLIDYTFVDEPKADYKIKLKDGTIKEITVNYQK